MRRSNFISKLVGVVDLPEEVIDEILEVTHRVKHPKRTILLEPGQVCSRFYFIEKGLARTYFISGSKELTTDLCIDQEFLADFSSFFSQQPSTQYIELLENSELYYMEYKDLQSLYDKHSVMERLGRLIAEYHYTSLSAHTYNLKFNTTSERYKQLFTRKLEVIKRTPIGIIASYLGMSIENLSRIRSKVG